MTERGWWTGAVDGPDNPEPHPSVTPLSGESADPDLTARLARALGPDFEIRGLLGRGGFADVYELFDRNLERALAVKVLRPDIALGPWLAARFDREARALASLFHLNIPPIHFVGDNEGLTYYVMPLIRGRSLAAMMEARGPLDPDLLADVMIPVLEALDYAHSHGIVHRDIKPDNIILEEETQRPLVLDFGVAKRPLPADLQTTASLPGMILGTPGYISPEQALGHEVDGRSDVYSVGATMFHLLTGTTTFSGDTPRSIIGQQITAEVPVPTTMNARIPEWLSDVVVCALSRLPEHRYQSAAAMAEALRVGRRSGVRRPVTPSRLVERIRDDDPTPRMVPVLSPVVATDPPWKSRKSVPEPPSRPAPVAASGRPRRITVLGACLLIAVGAWFLVVPQTFMLRNQLVQPIEVSTNDGAVRSIAPGGQLVMPFPADGKVLTRWFVVQPRAAEDQAPIGEPISGTVRVDALSALDLTRRRAIRSVNSWVAGSIAFAPRIVNRTSQPVTVIVNRMRGGFNCGCTVGPGETLLLGYYRLEDSSFVRVSDAAGRFVLFRGLQSRMDPTTGVVELNIVDTILSRSPA